MNRDEVLELFRSKAQALQGTYSRSGDTIGQLADVIAHCSGRIPQEDIDSLVCIGGTLVKLADTKTRARAEVADTMKNLHDSGPYRAD